MTFRGLRIGLIGPLPPPAGGMANQTRQLAELLEREGATVSIVRTNAPYRPAWMSRVKWIRSAARFVPYVLGLWRCAGRVELFHVVANSGWSWHLFATPAIWIAKLRGIPVLVNYRGGEAEGFLARQARWVVPTLRRADLIAVPSGFLRDIFTRFDVAAMVVPNVVDLGRFTPQNVRRGPLRGPLRFAVVRNLEAIYDNATAIRAFARVLEHEPDASLIVAGSGPERAALEGLAHELAVAERVTFTGALDRDEVAALYQTTDVAINPSTVDNMPNSVLEALASGVPVVSTRVGGVPHMVQDGITALLVPPAVPGAMCEAILSIVRDEQLASRLRENGLLEVQRYTWMSVGPRLLAAYETIMRRRSPSMLVA